MSARLVVGFASRFAAAALLGMTFVIQVFVYPGNWPAGAAPPRAGDHRPPFPSVAPIRGAGGRPPPTPCPTPATGHSSPTPPPTATPPAGRATPRVGGVGEGGLTPDSAIGECKAGAAQTDHDQARLHSRLMAHL